MKDFYNAIYLSPHFDDAALSCGGQIYDMTTNRKSVLIVTIMAGDPANSTTPAPASQYVESLHNRWQLEEDVVGARLAEDVAACNIMGADWQHWDFLDCIYRVDIDTKRPFYTSDEDIFGQIDPAESNLVNRIATRIALLPTCNQLYIPLTIGHHVDHQLTRKAAEQLFPRTLLHYYEDYPYVRHLPIEQIMANEAADLHPKIIKLSDNAVTARINAISCFESQLSTFFNDQNDLARQVQAYINTVGGERIWVKTKPKPVSLPYS